MTRPGTFLLLLATAIALGIGLAVRSADADPSTVIEATTVPIHREVVTRKYQSVDHGSQPGSADDRTGTTKWRVVASTGNCCENYLTTSKQGRLFDFGGTYLHFSDDRGLTWKQVEPLTPLITGEGTIAVAPNGDIIGIGWDPYSGDHLQAYKYEAFSGKWWYDELPLHQPFYAVTVCDFNATGEWLPPEGYSGAITFGPRSGVAVVAARPGDEHVEGLRVRRRHRPARPVPSRLRGSAPQRHQPEHVVRLPHFAGRRPDVERAHRRALCRHGDRAVGLPRQQEGGRRRSCDPRPGRRPRPGSGVQARHQDEHAVPHVALDSRGGPDVAGRH
jgi:hypothetical protein